MNVIAKRALREFWGREPRAQAPLEAWFSIVRHARGSGPADIKAAFRSADFVSDNRVIFNIGGNKYRLIVHVSYAFGRVLIKFVGTHEEYDDIDPGKI